MNLFSLFKKTGESGLTYSELEIWLNIFMKSLFVSCHYCPKKNFRGLLID